MDSMMILELKVRWGYFLGLISFASCICYNLYHTTAEVNLKLLYLRPLVIGSPLPTELSDEDILSDFFLEFGRFSLSISNSDYSLLRYSLSSRPFDPATSNPCLAFSSSFSILFLYLCAGIKQLSDADSLLFAFFIFILLVCVDSFGCLINLPDFFKLIFVFLFLGLSVGVMSVLLLLLGSMNVLLAGGCSYYLVVLQMYSYSYSC